MARVRRGRLDRGPGRHRTARGLDAIGDFWDEAHAIPDSIELRLGELRIVIGQEAALTLESRPNLGGETYRFDVIDHMSFDAEGRSPRTARSTTSPPCARRAIDFSRLRWSGPGGASCVGRGGSPDQVWSMAQTLLSTMPVGSATSRTTSSVTSVSTPRPAWATPPI